MSLKYDVTFPIAVIFSITVLQVSSLVYPEARRDPSIIDDYFGVKVGDPYRWLEDPNSNETKQFVEAQKALSSDFLGNIEERREIEKLLKSFLGYERFGPYIKKYDKYFYFYNSGLQNHNVLMKLNQISDPPEPFLDPNLMSDDGSTALYPYYYSFSSEAQHFVYALSNEGSDWLEGRIRDVNTNQDLPERLINIKWPEFSFTKAGDGVFYSRFPLGEDGIPVTSNPQIFYHKLNTPQSEDVFVADNADNPNWFLFSKVSNCGNYLMILPQPDFQSNGINIASLVNFNGTQDLEFTNVIQEPYDARYIYITNTETNFVFLSDKDAPKFRVISIDIGSANVGPIKELIPEDPSKFLKSVDALDGDKLVLIYLEDVKHKLSIHSLTDGALLQEISSLPFEGVITGFSCFRDNNEFSFQFENIVSPGIIYRCMKVENSSSIECQTLHEMNLNGVDMGNYEMNQVFVSSMNDGTKVPVFIGHRKDLSTNGENPALLYGYGGFNVDVLPSFNLFRFAFIELFGGLYVSSNLRGGAEYGEPWHQAGSGLNKQNTFDDFLSVAKFLIDANYTSSKHLVIEGSSNGGLLVAASINQMPNLFAVGLPQVGLLDMLRFQKTSAIGYAWCSEYGCSDNSQFEFINLYGYSPLHNIYVRNDTTFPAMLITTAANDDRVAPSNSFKYTAELQYQMSNSTNQTSPILLRVTANAGHNYEDMPLEQQLEGYVDSYAFVTQVFRSNNLKSSSIRVNASNVSMYFTCCILVLHSFLCVRSYDNLR